MQVAVLSDTHGLLREEVLKVVSESDAVLHAGDLAGPEILEQLTRAKKPEAPLYVVRGNNDRGSWGQTIPALLRFSLGGRRFLMVHDRKDIPENPGDAQVIVFGHSHRFLEERREGRLWLNPGSCGRSRFGMEVTMAVLTLEEASLRAEKVVLLPAKQKREKGTGCGQAEITASRIQKLMNLMDRGKSVDEIAEKTGIDRELAEQICRIRVTHPGVTAGGILDKMEVNKRWQR